MDILFSLGQTNNSIANATYTTTNWLDANTTFDWPDTNTTTDWPYMNTTTDWPYMNTTTDWPYMNTTTDWFFTNGTGFSMSENFTTYPLTTTASTLAHVSNDFGKVKACSLSGIAETIQVNGRTYCAVKKGNMNHADAVQSCRSENARLPLPKNDDEVNSFRTFSKVSSWIDLSVSCRIQNYDELFAS